MFLYTGYLFYSIVYLLFGAFVKLVEILLIWRFLYEHVHFFFEIFSALFGNDLFLTEIENDLSVFAMESRVL